MNIGGSLLNHVPQPSAPQRGTFEELGQQQSLTALGDVQGRVNDILTALGPFEPIQITDQTGRVYTVLAYDSGRTEAYVPPFLVRSRRATNGTWYVYLQPGKIRSSWESSLEVSPTITGLSTNTVANPVYVAVATGGVKTLYARTEVEPVASEVAEDSWEISDATTVTLWDIDFHDTSDAEAMAINPATGAVVNNGVYYMAIAECEITDGQIGINQLMLGPITAKFCHASLTVLPAPVASVLVTITAE